MRKRKKEKGKNEGSIFIFVLRITLFQPSMFSFPFFILFIQLTRKFVITFFFVDTLRQVCLFLILSMKIPFNNEMMNYGRQIIIAGLFASFLSSFKACLLMNSFDWYILRDCFEVWLNTKKGLNFRHTRMTINEPYLRY